MERFHSYVGSAESALEQAPEVFHSVSVNLSIYVASRMVNNLVLVFTSESLIPHQFICKKRRTGGDMFPHDGLQSFLAAIWYNVGANLTATFQYAHDSGFIFHVESLTLNS